MNSDVCCTRAVDGRREQGGRRREASAARLHLFMTVMLVASIAVAATAISIGFARAQTVTAGHQPDAGLVLALMLVAIGLMGALSAIAVRLVGRPRHRAKPAARG